MGSLGGCLLAALLLVSELDGATYTSNYLGMRVDHFSYTNNDTFYLHFLVNDTFWAKGTGPIFLFPGGEERIEFFAANAGFVWESAATAGAFVVFAEHRFQGRSVPYGQWAFSSLKQLGFLTIEQTLADLGDLITYLQTSYVAMTNSPVIVMGYGYSGQLAAWMRIKYPHLVLGAVASSAPVLQQSVPCEAFKRTLTEAFNQTSPACVSAIRRSWAALDALLSTPNGPQWLEYEWNLCYGIYHQNDISWLKSWLTDVYTYLAYYNYPYPTRVGKTLPANPIQEACRPLGDAADDDESLFKALFQAVSVYNNFTGTEPCLNIYSSVLLEKATPAFQFQRCSELVYPHCSDGVNDFFEQSSSDLGDKSYNCNLRWGIWPQQHYLKKNFPSPKLGTTSNIIFVNGLLDPQSAGSVLQNVSDSVLAFNIPGGAHHADFRFSNAADPPAVLQARAFVLAHLSRWVQDGSPIEPRRKRMTTLRPPQS